MVDGGVPAATAERERMRSGDYISWRISRTSTETRRGIFLTRVPTGVRVSSALMAIGIRTGSGQIHFPPRSRGPVILAMSRRPDGRWHYYRVFDDAVVTRSP